MSFKSTKSHKNETVEHFVTKCIVWKILLEANRKAQIERDSGAGVNDCFDWTTGTVYEIEPHIRKDRLILKNNEYKVDALVKEVIMLPYKEIFENAGISEDQVRKLKKEIEKYIQV
jgi:hypothetical protein